MQQPTSSEEPRTTRPSTGDRSAPEGRFVTPRSERVEFGPGAVGRLGESCQRLDVSRLFVVVSPSLGRAFPVRELLTRASGGRMVETYDGTRPHVPHDVVLDATKAAQTCGADAVVSIGGGSPIDLAKAVTLCLSQGIRTREQLLALRAAGATHRPALPHIAISTTLSAGEFTGIIGVTDTVRGVKDVYDAPWLTPTVVLLDPDLARHTPSRVWASTGIKAVDHAVETLCSVNAQPITDALAAAGLARMARHLPGAAADADDLHARGQCQIAAWQSIYGLGNVRMGLSHGLGHQLGGRAGVPHGITSCVLLARRPRVQRRSHRPAAGGDRRHAMDLSTRARRDGDEYVVDGRKWLITNSDFVSHFLVLAKTAGKEVSAIIVPRDTPGFTSTPLPETMGCKGGEHGELTFTDVRVPAANLVGAEGEGIAHLERALEISRVFIAASSLGTATRALELSLTYAKERVTFGRAIAERQAIQRYLAEMATDVYALRGMLADVATKWDRGRRIPAESSMLKQFGLEAVGRVTDRALLVHGGVGYTRMYPIERLYRDARLNWLEEGTPTIQYMVAARELLDGYTFDDAFDGSGRAR